MNTYLHPKTEKINRAQIANANLARVQALGWLAQTFPEAFNTECRVRPLKKGILQDIFDYIEQNDTPPFSKSKIREAVVMFTRRMEYLVCVKSRNTRVNLLGEPAGDITDAEAEFAAEQIRQHVENAIEKADKPPRSRRYDACEKFAPRARDLLRKEKQEATTSFNVLQHEEDNFYPAMERGTVTPSCASSDIYPANNQAQPQVTIRRKVSKRIDPDAVARLKAKLGIKKESA